MKMLLINIVYTESRLKAVTSSPVSPGLEVIMSNKQICLLTRFVSRHIQALDKCLSVVRRRRGKDYSALLTWE